MKEKNRMGIIEDLMKGLGYTKKGAGASVWPSYLDDPMGKPRPPKWSLPLLYDESEKSWVVQAGVQLLIREAMRPGWNPVSPKFVKKCKKCHSEFIKSVDVCPECGGKRFETPDPSQKRRILSFMSKPNGNRETWGDILYSMFYHDAIADKWYLSVAYSPVYAEGNSTPANYIPQEIYNEDSRYIQPVLDDRGRLGGPPYFCPHCNDEKKSPVHSDKPGKCPRCGLPLEKTAYVQKVGDEVYNRFAVSEMVNGSTYRPSPDPDGQPRLVSAWQSLFTVKAMDEWFYDTYSEGILGKIVYVSSMKQEDANDLAQSVKSQIASLDKIDATTGEARTKKTARMLFIGGGATANPRASDNIAVHNLVDDPTAMRAIEYYLTCVSGILSVFGVQAIYLNAEQSGRVGGAPAIKMDIQNHVIEELQRDKEEVINKQLYPIFGITDYEFKFNPLVKKDELVEAQTKQAIANTALNLLNAGVDFDIDENWVIVPKGRVEQEQMPQQQRPQGETVQQPKISGATHQIIRGTTTERDSHNTGADNRVKKP